MLHSDDPGHPDTARVTRIDFSESNPILDPEWKCIPQGWYARPLIRFAKWDDKWELEYDTVNDHDQPDTPALELLWYGAAFALENPVPVESLDRLLQTLQPELVALAACLEEDQSDYEVYGRAADIAEGISDQLTCLSEAHVMDYWEVLDAAAEKLIDDASEYLPEGFELTHTLLDDGGVRYTLTKTATGESNSELDESDLEAAPELCMKWAVKSLTKD